MNNNTKLTANLPLFSTIDPSKIVTDLEKILQNHRQEIDKLLSQPSFTWQNLVQPMEEMSDKLNKMWSPISHLHNVRDSKPLREAYNECIPKLSDYSTELSQNPKLFQATQHIAQNAEAQHLNKAQRKVLENDIRDYKLSGVDLPEQQKKQFAQLSKELSQLSTQFEENVLDATMGWYKHVNDESALVGLPDYAKHAAAEAAAQRQLKGWVFTLEYPSYVAIMTHADQRELRQEMYHAYSTRASDQGPNAGKWDNSTIMLEILRKRLELAQILGFANYAERSLATKMVKNTDQVLKFLQELAKASHHKAQEEFKELAKFAREELNLTQLFAWDIAYASEKLSLARYAISQEELRPYFPEYKALEGLFTIVSKLFSVQIEEVTEFDRYHPDVRCFAVYDKNNTLRSMFLLDLYARENKRGGAWMDDCRVRRVRTDGSLQIPVAYVNCNFNRPIGDAPALFSHDEVVTLFHEFGHALQHMLTTVDYAEVSGINGIPWDAVEVASQFLENWAWEKDSIHFITEHYQTKQPLPAEMFARMHRAKNFQTAMAMVRQLEFALFDFRLHMEFNPHEQGQVQRILNEVRTQVSVVPIPEFNRFQNNFTHIFGGGYAAGYYSYKWAEVMAADAFGLFLETGIFNQHTSDQFLKTFLQSGGVEEPLNLFVEFRGREPQVDALLQQSGIIE